MISASFFVRIGAKGFRISLLSYLSPSTLRSPTEHRGGAPPAPRIELILRHPGTKLIQPSNNPASLFVHGCISPFHFVACFVCFCAYKKALHIPDCHSSKMWKALVAFCVLASFPPPRSAVIPFPKIQTALPPKTIYSTYTTPDSKIVSSTFHRFFTISKSYPRLFTLFHIFLPSICSPERKKRLRSLEDISP